jgi:hypothetical protein
MSGPAFSFFEIIIGGHDDSYQDKGLKKWK